jgi:hypothetical protein
MSSLNEEVFDDNVELLTKPKQKKPRSEAQIAATERMRESLLKKSAPVATEKKMILKAIKDKLNGPPKNAPVEEESEEEAPTAPPVVVKRGDTPRHPEVKKEVKKGVPRGEPPRPKKEPKVIYESASESEEEVVIVKKKKKPKKKTIIYEESESEEEPEPAPKPKSRETKTQQNLRSSSVFKVTAEPTKPSGPVYYFA